ncbi:hypothetical protein [Paraburkholderia flagellata]|nr:hypothetical protein [Paraburkholderia flagellata]
MDFLNLDLSNRARAKLTDAVTLERTEGIRVVVEGMPDAITSVVVH